LKDFSGKMYVEFIIGTTGKIENLEIIKSCGKKEFDQEVIKIIKASPSWKPAKIKGVNVKQKFIMDLQIKL
jgi:protein TonB